MRGWHNRVGRGNIHLLDVPTAPPASMGIDRLLKPVDRTMDRDALQSDDDVKERQYWRFTLRVVWTVLIILVVAGILTLLTATLRWAHLLLAALGILAGLSLLLALLGSARSRQVTGFGLGVIALPTLAIWLSSLVATSPESYAAWSAGIGPFLAHAAGAVFGGLLIERVWRVSEQRADSVALHQGPDKGGPG